MASANTTHDTIIVGQGLAGTTLAWRLIDSGQRVLVIDADEPVTSSKIAAGLITPITGQRLALSWRVEEMLGEARTFYAGVEQRTGNTFFHARTATRLFKSDNEREIWQKRSALPAFRAHLASEQPSPLLAPELGDASGGGFDMETAQLDVAAYLAASRTHIDNVQMTLDWRGDVLIGTGHVAIGDYTARRIISCEGFAATRNPYFAGMRFKGAKGDILTVRFHAAFTAKCLHRGIWVVPTPEPDVYRVGATYDWTHLDHQPSVSARAEIEHRLQEFVRVPYTVIGHQAAVRPIIRESKALIGLHPHYPALGFFNGLGSKGSLHAPWFAKCFADHLIHGVEIPSEFDLQRKWTP
ncbi:MAG: FAD-binding oxidoreductase [Hyphomicrobium sp.]